LNIKKIIILLLFVIAIITILTPVNAAKSYEDQVLDLVNKERAKVGVSPLKMDKDLKNFAKIRSKELQTKFSHIRPNGKLSLSLSPKIDGENIAYWKKTPKEVMKAWMSDDHRINILHPEYKTVGIGYYKGKYPYWVQLFSRQDPNKSTKNDSDLNWTKYDSGKFEIKKMNNEFKKKFQPYVYYTAYMKKDNQLYVDFYYKTKSNKTVISEKVSFTKNKTNNYYLEMKYTDYIDNFEYSTYIENNNIKDEYMKLKNSVKSYVLVHTYI